MELDRPSGLEVLPRSFNCHWLWFWVAVGALMGLGHFLVAALRGAAEHFWQIPIIAAVMFAWICIEIIWSHKELIAFRSTLANMLPMERQGEVLQWYTERTNRTYSTNNMAAVGVFGFLVGTALYLVSGMSFWHSDPLIVAYDLMFYGAVAFVGGMSQWAFYNISFTVSRLSNFPIKPKLYGHRNSNILSIGYLLSQIWLGGIGLIILAELAFMVAPLRSGMVLQIVLAGGSLGAVVWYFTVQRNLHHLMVYEKQTRMAKIGDQIEMVLDRLATRFEKDQFDILQELKVIYSEVKSLPEWPFDTGTLVRFLSASASPLLTVVLQYAVKAYQ